jgi:hypothetical protein
MLLSIPEDDFLFLKDKVIGNWLLENIYSMTLEQTKEYFQQLEAIQNRMLSSRNLSPNDYEIYSILTFGIKEIPGRSIIHN